MTKSKTFRSATRARNTALALAGLEDGTYENKYRAAKATGTSSATIARLLKGGRTRREANIHNQYLTPMEESVLVNFVQRAAAVGHPIRHSYLRELAETLHKKRVGGDAAIPVGKHWVERFLRRNPVLKSQIAKSIEQARVEVTKEQVLEWFRQYKEEINAYGIVAENIYNMDESGDDAFQMAN